MNPFTKFLSQWSRNRPFQEFVAHWDALEHIVVGVYREKMTTMEAELEFERVWPWLRGQYGQWEGDLRPFWQATQAGGEPTRDDPFAMLMAFEEPKDILGDWRAMQHLPAAREALNRYILSKQAD